MLDILKRTDFAIPSTVVVSITGIIAAVLVVVETAVASEHSVERSA